MPVTESMADDMTALRYLFWKMKSGGCILTDFIQEKVNGKQGDVVPRISENFREWRHQVLLKVMGED